MRHFTGTATLSRSRCRPKTRLLDRSKGHSPATCLNLNMTPISWERYPMTRSASATASFDHLEIGATVAEGKSNDIPGRSPHRRADRQYSMVNAIPERLLLIVLATIKPDQRDVRPPYVVTASSAWSESVPADWTIRDHRTQAKPLVRRQSGTRTRRPTEWCWTASSNRARGPGCRRQRGRRGEAEMADHC